MFKIRSNPRRRLLHVVLEGFFNMEELGSFVQAAQKAVADMGCASGDWFHICDISTLPLQSQQVTEAIDGFINHPERRSKRLAVVTGQSPARMQIRRLLKRSDAAMFATMAEAESWVFGAQERRLSA